MKKYLFLLVLICFFSCSEDEDLREVPVTNNPHIVPDTASPIVGMPII